MPVVDEHGMLVGMISVTDIFRAAEERVAPTTFFVAVLTGMGSGSVMSLHA
jgi:CBS domain-containing protein